MNAAGLTFYYHPSPNPAKVALFLEEAGLAYGLAPVDVQRGEQHATAFLAVNPNGKTPAIVDDGVSVFDSNAILLYLAEKTGRFLGVPTPEGRAALLSWLMFIATGIGPYSGQAVHFRHVAPGPRAYAFERYDYEAWRHWRVIDAHLAERTWMVGDDYTIVDMAFWGWARAVPFVLGEEAWAQLPNAKRLFDRIAARPAAARAEALRDAQAFKDSMDAETLAAMYRHAVR